LSLHKCMTICTVWRVFAWANFWHTQLCNHSRLCQVGLANLNCASQTHTVISATLIM
jgi:hypothetical protein